MKVRIKRQPTGYISIKGGPLQVWPAAGEVVDLPEVVAQDLVDSGAAEKVVVAKATSKVETRPASNVGAETRAAGSAAKG